MTTVISGSPESGLSFSLFIALQFAKPVQPPYPFRRQKAHRQHGVIIPSEGVMLNGPGDMPAGFCRAIIIRQEFLTAKGMVGALFDIAPFLPFNDKTEF